MFSRLIINIFPFVFLASSKIYHVHRIKRDDNITSPSVTKVQNVTTTGVPTVATTWPTRRRNTPGPTGRPALSLTGKFRRNRSTDHLGFPIIPNSPRGTRRPLPPTQSNTSRPIANSRKGLNGIMGEIRERENKTQTTTLSSNMIISTDPEQSSKVSHTEEAQKNTRHDYRQGMPRVISKHGIWITVVTSLLSVFICLTVHWVRQRRRGKLIITPVGDNGQRSAAVVYKA